MPDRGVPGPAAGLPALSALALVLACVGLACTGEPAAQAGASGPDNGRATAPSVSTPVVPASALDAAENAGGALEDSIPGTAWTRGDWEIFRGALLRADALGLDTLPHGLAVGEMGRFFVGTPYVPGTLEMPGRERLVINFRGLDCVTFVENVLALTRFHRAHGVEALADAAQARAMYEAELASLRYREGRPVGYGSRLHYFSDWLTDGLEDGRLLGPPEELALTADPRPIGFMSANPDAYPALSNRHDRFQIEAVEEALNQKLPRLYLPQGEIAAQAAAIRTGDVIAAKSTVEGLDIAHTGIAYWVDGALHLLHAPLVGSTVVLSERTLAQRVQDIRGQDGIMVSRPNPEWLDGGR